MSSTKPEKNSINSGHYLELMDRLHVVNCTIDDHILNHPLTEHHKDIQDKIGNALELLFEAYQMVGHESYEYDEKENNTH
jgi:hypothetical protein